MGSKLIVVLTLSTAVLACGDHVPAQVYRRQATGTTTYPTGAAYDVPPLASITPTPVTYSEHLVPVLATYTPGAIPPLSGAPPLPTYTIFPRQWPDLSSTPPTNSPQVQEWMQELNGHDIPSIPVNPTVNCGDAVNAAAFASAGSSGHCWWTCGGCTRESDITQCKDEWEWGHTYDDGPGFYTNKLLTYLNSLPPTGPVPTGVAPGVKATFFVVGARVISRPEIVVYEYMNNHEISVHTWSHAALTTLTNEQIVAELGWTRKAIRDVIGVTPLTFRPPYGDIDDRVRAIALAMGMRPVIWTSSMEGVPVGGSAIQWDSQDWRVHAGTVNSTSNQASFESILNTSSQFANTTSVSYSPTMQGVVVLQHDIYVESVNLAIGYTLPFASSHSPSFKLSTVSECQPRSDNNGGKWGLSEAYLETNTDLGNPAWIAADAARRSDSVVESQNQNGNGTTRSSGESSSTGEWRNGALEKNVGVRLAAFVMLLGALVG